MTIRRLLRQVNQAAEREAAEKAIIGWLQSDGSYAYDVPGRPDAIKVTLIANGVPTTRDAVQFRGGTRDGGRAVLVQTDEYGIRYVGRPDPTSASQQANGQPTTADFVAAHGYSHHAAGGDPVLIDALQILPGLVFGISGTEVQVGRVDPDGTRHDTVYYVNGEPRILPAATTYDWASDAAGIASGKQAYIAIVIDPAANELGALVGADQSGLVPSLDAALIEAFDFTDLVPLWAFRAESGQTGAPQYRDIIDLRPFAGNIFTLGTAAFADSTDFADAVHNHAAVDIASGTLIHERGGLEADVSAYSGLLKISGGATSQVTAPSGAIVGDTDTQTLTGKTIDGDANTLLIATSDANVSAPPTAAELDTAFGARSDGFTAILDDNGAGTTNYLIVRKNSAWWHLALTKAT